MLDLSITKWSENSGCCYRQVLEDIIKGVSRLQNPCDAATAQFSVISGSPALTLPTPPAGAHRPPPRRACLSFQWGKRFSRQRARRAHFLVCAMWEGHGLKEKHMKNSAARTPGRLPCLLTDPLYLISSYLVKLEYIVSNFHYKGPYETLSVV